MVEEFKNNEYKQYCSNYTFVPFTIKPVRRIVVFGDIHGDYRMAVKLLQMSGVARVADRINLTKMKLEESLEEKITNSKITDRKINYRRSRRTRRGTRVTKNNIKDRETQEIIIEEEKEEKKEKKTSENLYFINKHHKEDYKYIMEWIGGDTYVVQVGDQIDRCRPIPGTKMCSDPCYLNDDEDSDIKILELFTDLHEQAVKVGGSVISLLGNHELLNSMGEMGYVSYMNAEGMKEKYKVDGTEFKDGFEARKHAFKPGNLYGRYLGCTRQASVIIGSNLFVHAGIIDKLIEQIGLKGIQEFEDINILVKKWLMGLVNMDKSMHIISSNDSMFWTRILGSLPSNLPESDIDCQQNISQVLKIFKINGMIIGHTPQSFLFNKDINHTCGNKIWRVDNGSSSAFDIFDKHYTNSHHKHHNRRFQYLEIINDNEYHVYDEHGKVY